jgi:hypothetical protein
MTPDRHVAALLTMTIPQNAWCIKPPPRPSHGVEGRLRLGELRCRPSFLGAVERNADDHEADAEQWNLPEGEEADCDCGRRKSAKVARGSRAIASWSVT